MSKGSNPTNVTTTTSAEPSEFVKPYVTEAFGQAQDLFQSNAPNYYPNQTYTDFAPQTETALQLAQLRALNNPLLNSSQNEINSILQGDYLSPTTNPYSQALYNQMAGDVTAGVQSQFSKAGRLGSAANQRVLADELGNLANEVYGGQYDTERANMVNATAMAPQLAQADYQDIEALAGVGATREQMEMAKIQDAMARFDFEQQKPYYKLREYLGSIGSNKVTVPKYYYKVAIDPKNIERNIAILIENKESSENIKNFIVSIDSLESITDIDFFYRLDDSLEKKIESSTHENLWYWRSNLSNHQRSNHKTKEGNISLFRTISGSKYHKEGCRHLSKSKIPTSLNELKNSSLRPCSVCKP